MKFLMEKDTPYYDKERDASLTSSKDADKFVKKVYKSMKAQSSDKSVRPSSLLQAKDNLEVETATNYDKLQGGDRNNFVKDCLGNMENADVFKQAENSIAKHIVDDNWKNKHFIGFLELLPTNIELDDDTVDLIYDLQTSKKIDRIPQWLSDPSLYNRPYKDRLYTIKALTFADNPKLQTGEDGDNMYFDNKNPLTVKDLMKNGEILPATQIETVINDKQTKEIQTKSNKKDLDNANKIKKELIAILGEMQKTDVNALVDEYLKDGDTAQDALQRMYDNGFKL